MAAETNVLTRSFPIADAADLSADQYKIISLNAGVAEVANATAGIGVLQNKPEDGGTGGRTASVMLLGTSRVVSGAAISEGVLVTADANGKAVAAGAGALATGLALEAASGADEIIEILLTPGGQAA